MTAQSATRDAIAEEQNSLVGEWSFDRVSRGIDSVGGGFLELALSRFQRTVRCLCNIFSRYGSSSGGTDFTGAK